MVASVEGNTIRVTHKNALYNCCLDDVEVELVTRGTVLELIETEILTYPCYCRCGYDVDSEIAPVGSGVYILRVWNADRTEMFGEAEVVVE